MASLWHLQAVQGIVDVEAIRRCNFPVFVDANGGAGGPLAQPLLEELRCRVRGVGLVPDGYFRHPPEPNPENLREVTALVKQSGAVIGFCQDPDADRLVLVDPDRGPLSEEYTLALCLDHVLARRKGPVVINCASSLMNDWIAACHQVALFRVPVGEAHVVRGMMEKQAIFGGEGNGGPIDPRVGWIRDSFVGMALILEALATSGKTLSELVGRLPVFAMQKLKVARPAVPLERIYAPAAGGLSLGPERFGRRPSPVLERPLADMPTQQHRTHPADYCRSSLAPGARAALPAGSGSYWDATRWMILQAASASAETSDRCPVFRSEHLNTFPRRGLLLDTSHLTPRQVRIAGLYHRPGFSRH